MSRRKNLSEFSAGSSRNIREKDGEDAREQGTEQG